MPKKPVKSTLPDTKAKKADGKTAAKPKAKPKARAVATHPPVPPLNPAAPNAQVLDRLWSTIIARKSADPLVSHSARLLSRGINKVAQKFGEESVECLIEAVSGNRAALIAESADVLYHLLVMWVAAGLRPEDVWLELQRREGISGIAEKASRPMLLSIAETRKIP
ncbi:MAG TPA: phosphoribosyl-ATP diphosphatase [Acidiphilium sp.]|nr:phosphoribosyl-ATP diphosphatase [Acidiphilium sp.]